MKPLPLPEALKAARKAAGMTQAQVAAICGWDPPSRYANYEQGLREPTLADLRVIAAAVAAGGHDFVRIVTGQPVASQPARLDADIIRAAIILAKKSFRLGADEELVIERDPEVFAQALRAALATRERLEAEHGVRPGSGDGQTGAAGGPAGAPEDGKATQPAARRRKRA